MIHGKERDERHHVVLNVTMRASPVAVSSARTFGASTSRGEHRLRMSPYERVNDLDAPGAIR
jgi:hypothetical protein